MNTRFYLNAVGGALAFASLCLAPRGTLGAGQAAPSVSPLEQRETDRVHSAGLFVGVGQFETGSGLDPLRYAPDDAVALANLFVTQLELILPGQAFLALGGEPVSERARRQLAQLRQAGVQFSKAERKDVLKAVKTACEKASDERGLLVMAFSTHGYQQAGLVYLMPTDGESSDLPGTAVPVESVKNSLGTLAKAGKRILIVDACREPRESSAKGRSVLPSEFATAFEQARGCAVIFSCSPGQRSWEDREAQQGVFTRFLVESFSGTVPGDPGDGLIKLGSVMKYAARKTEEWVLEHQRTQQQPKVLDCDAAWPGIPMAIDGGRKAEIVRLNAQREAAVEQINTVRAKHRDVFSAALLEDVETALRKEQGERLASLLKQCELAHQQNTREATEAYVAWFKQFASARPAPVPLVVQTNPPATPPPPAPARPATSSLWANGKPRLKVLITDRLQKWDKHDTELTVSALLKAMSDTGRFQAEPLTVQEWLKHEPAKITDRDCLLHLHVEEFVADRVFDLDVVRRDSSAPFVPTCSIKASWTLLDKAGQTVTAGNALAKYDGAKVVARRPLERTQAVAGAFRGAVNSLVASITSQLVAGLPK
jgi:hypothetical protein